MPLVPILLGKRIAHIADISGSGITPQDAISVGYGGASDAISTSEFLLELALIAGVIGMASMMVTRAATEE